MTFTALFGPNCLGQMKIIWLMGSYGCLNGIGCGNKMARDGNLIGQLLLSCRLLCVHVMSFEVHFMVIVGILMYYNKGKWDLLSLN